MSTRLWHPFSDMAAVDGNEFVVDRAEGVWVYDEDGRRYLGRRQTEGLLCQ